MLNIDRARVAIVSILALTACQANGTAMGQERVEVYIKGSHIATPENIATRRLRDAIEAAVSERQDIGLAIAGTGNLIVRIPDDVPRNRKRSGRSAVCLPSRYFPSGCPDGNQRPSGRGRDHASLQKRPQQHGTRYCS